MDYRGARGIGASGRPALVAGLVFALALVLRLMPLLGRGGLLAWPVDFDEGVYFSDALLLSKGLLPYRDLTLVHPPGLVLFLSPLGWLAHLLGPRTAFESSRLVMVVVSALGAAAVAWVGFRWWGVWCGLFAGVLTALHPDLLFIERGPRLEPMVNLLAVVGCGVALLGEPSRRRSILGGALVGLAASVKLTALPLVAVLAVVVQRRGGWRQARATLVGAAGAWGVVVLPFLFAAPGAAWRQMVVFQGGRPRDGHQVERIRRALYVLLPGREGSLALRWGIVPVVAMVAAARVVAAAGWMALRRGGPTGQFVLGTLLVEAAILVAVDSFWFDYAAATLPWLALLLGFGVAQLVESRSPRYAAIGLLVVIVSFGLVSRLKLRADRSDELVAFGASVDAVLDPEASLFSFEPAWALAANRTPGALGPGRPVLDTYAELILWSGELGTGDSPDTLFHRADVQRRFLERASSADAIVLGPWGRRMLTDETRAGLSQTFVCAIGCGGGDQLDLWVHASGRAVRAS